MTHDLRFPSASGLRRSVDCTSYGFKHLLPSLVRSCFEDPSLASAVPTPFSVNGFPLQSIDGDWRVLARKRDRELKLWKFEKDKDRTEGEREWVGVRQRQRAWALKLWEREREEPKARERESSRVWFWTKERAERMSGSFWFDESLLSHKIVHVCRCWVGGALQPGVHWSFSNPII